MAEFLDRFLARFFRVPEELIAEHAWTGKLYLSVTVLSIAGMVLVPVATALAAFLAGGPTGSEWFTLPFVFAAAATFGAVSGTISWFLARGVARFRNWARMVSMLFLFSACAGGLAMLTQLRGFGPTVMAAGEIALSGQFLWYFHRNRMRFLRARRSVDPLLLQAQPEQPDRPT
jgi:hypothetical protein